MASLSAGSVLELAAQMNQLVGQHLVDGESLQQLIEARDLQVRSGLGKDPQVVATTAARRLVGDRLMRVVTPHELLDLKDPGAGRPGWVGRPVGRYPAACADAQDPWWLGDRPRWSSVAA